MAENDQQKAPQIEDAELELAQATPELEGGREVENAGEQASHDDSKVSPIPLADAGPDPPPGEGEAAAVGGLNIEELVVDNKNCKTLKCLRCGSTVLRPDNATYEKKEIFLPHMKKKKANQALTDGETLSDQWRIEGMYTFENVGFTNTVQNIKYLICADCEVGPIGWYDPSDANNFYVAMERVKHE